MSKNRLSSATIVRLANNNPAVMDNISESTISHVLRNNDDLFKPIIKWKDGDMKTLVTALREVIEKHRSKLSR
jgi:hypothetical protein